MVPWTEQRQLGKRGAIFWLDLGAAAAFGGGERWGKRHDGLALEEAARELLCL